MQWERGLSNFTSHPIPILITTFLKLISDSHALQARPNQARSQNFLKGGYVDV